MQQTKTTVDHGLWRRRGERYLDLLTFFSPERVLSDLGIQLLSDIETKNIIVYNCIILYLRIGSFEQIPQSCPLCRYSTVPMICLR
jgi:hypothetical protein